ncbi:MAG: hypothetical protein SFV52_11960 [Saprospiraceae bacterium]|nr:hypothetical protein [Saprospiraceae bacterium]
MRKVLLLFFFAVFLYVLDACCERFAYYDYHRLLIRQADLPSRSQNLPATGFEVLPDSLRFMAEGYMPVVTPMAYGTSCPDDGSEGTQYGLDTMLITADQAFDTLHPAGASLNDLFYSLDIWYADSTAGPLSQGLRGLDFYALGLAGLYFYTPYLPSDTSKVYTITFCFTKDNGQSACGSLSGVQFR